jgi:hypothetical protein
MTKNSLLAGLMAAALAASAAAGDIWVDDDGSNSLGDGSSEYPYMTVTWVLTNNLTSAGDVIKLKAGTYDEALGEVFPLSLPSEVDLIGTEFDTNGEPLALIGGDVDSSSVVALVLANATVANRAGIAIEGLRFVGQDTASVDAPSAVKVISRAGYDASVTIEGCLVERSEMNDGSSADRAALLFDLGHGESTITVQDCTVHAWSCAGIEVVAGTGTSETTWTQGWVKVLGCTLLVEGDEHADYGFRWSAEGDVWVNECHPVLRGNFIDASGATGAGGMDKGISIAIANTAGYVSVDHPEFEISRNQIVGCTLDGIELYNDPREDGSGHMSIWNFERNRVHGCGRSGLRVQKQDLGQYGGYINVVAKSNWWVGNDVGIQAVGEASGPLILINETIAGNDTWGLQLVTEDGNAPGGPGAMINCIVFGNGGCTNCDQFDPGDADWPNANTMLEYCDFDNWSGGQGNIDQPPNFVNAGAGNYHLAGNSPCIDAGDNTPDNGETITDLDIDSNDRTVDGDGDNRVHVDMGADEYEP